MLRKLTPTDYPALAALKRLIWPEHSLTAAILEQNDRQHDPRLWIERAIYEHAGHLIAAAYYGETPHLGKFTVFIEVHPDFRQRGLGSQIYDHLMTLFAPRHPTRLASSTRDDQQAAMRFLEKRGFKRALREVSSILAVQPFDPTQFGGVIEQVEASGIELISLRQLQASDPNWQQAWYEMEQEVVQDIPATDEHLPKSFEIFQAFITGKTIHPDSFFFARDGSRLVGTSGIFINPDDGLHSECGMTGVRRSHRRRGIALALKLKVIDYAQKMGIETIWTRNEEHNPMLRLNFRLGFQPAPAWLDYEKTLA